MQLLQYLDHFTLGLIVFAGLLVGRALIAIAPEEVEPGQKYFVLFQKVLFVVMLIVFGVLVDNLMMRLFILLLMGIFLYRIHQHILYDNNSYLIYTFIGLFLGFLPTSGNYLFAAFSCFLFGLPTASLQSKLIGMNAVMVYARIAVVMFVFMAIGITLNNFIA